MKLLRLLPSVLLLSVAGLAVAAPKGGKPPTTKPAVVPPPPAVGVDRTITITDATTAVEIRLAPAGQITTLNFPLAVKAADAVDPKNRLAAMDAQGSKAMVQGPVVVLVASSLAPDGAVAASLTVRLVDGATLNFALIATTGPFDRIVRVELALKERAGADDAQRLKMQIQDMQARLDECLQEGADEGAKKLAASILKRDLTKPDMFTVEKRAYRGAIDKQNRLLVETHYVFRLFELTYLVITVENRDPGKTWVLERAELAAVGAANTADVKVMSVEQELNAIPPGETSKMVIAFRMPQLETAGRFTLRLFEKNGPRHFELADLHL